MDHVELFQKIEGQDANIVISAQGTDIALEANHIRISLEGVITWNNNSISIDWAQSRIEEDEDGFVISVNDIVYSIMLKDAV